MLMVQGLLDGAGISYLEVDMSESLLAELSGARFGDLRLSKRLGKIADRLEKKPNLSIPGATEKRAEMEAAYRFFDNDKVMPEAILAPHVESTRRRIAAGEVVLLVQDTTELDLTRPEQQVQGVGPLDCESRFGLHYHPLMGFSPDGLCLGTLWSKTWTRAAIATRMTEAEKEKQRRARPIKKAFAGWKVFEPPEKWPRRVRQPNASAWRIAKPTCTKCSSSRARPLAGVSCTC